MDKTKVKVEFVITGNSFHPKAATESLKITPTESWVKGDGIQGKNLKRKDTCWIINTEYEDSLDINDQLFKIVTLLKDKKNTLIELKRTHNVEYLFGIVINVENNETPAMFFNSKFIEFANDVKAEFYIDLFVFS